jgi:phosphoglycerate dehydrogenase-like enzyme
MTSKRILCTGDLTTDDDLAGLRSAGYLVSTVSALVVAAQENSETIGMLNSKRLNDLKPGSVLVSIARPALLPSHALLQALKSGRLASAALDCFYPNDDANIDQLKEFMPDRLLVTPHIGYRTQDACRRTSAMAIDALQAMLDGKEHFAIVQP